MTTGELDALRQEEGVSIYAHDWRYVPERPKGQQAGMRPPRFRCARCGLDTGHLDRHRPQREQLLAYEDRPCQQDRMVLVTRDEMIVDCCDYVAMQARERQAHELIELLLEYRKRGTPAALVRQAGKWLKGEA